MDPWLLAGRSLWISHLVQESCPERGSRNFGDFEPRHAGGSMECPVCGRTYATSEVDCNCRLKKKACLMAAAEHATRPNVAKR